MVSAGKTILFVARCGESPCCSIVHVTPLWIVAYKAAGIHSVPLVSALENSFVNNDKAHKNENPTLLDFCAAQFPEIKLISGKKPVEGGLLHRLDFETQGLVLIARTDGAYKFLSDEQAAGR
jgi:23S rRNA pseudouridine1911/1915/1917 synthase